MNYKESKKILGKIEDAENILLTCHKGPDCDSVSSTLSLKKVLEGMGKKVVIYCPDKIPDYLDFLSGVAEIEVKKFGEIDYSKFDIFIFTDSEHWGRVGLENAPQGVEVIVVDHHIHNEVVSEVSLVDRKASSTCEILFGLFQDWEMRVSPDLATLLFGGLLEDSGFCQFINTTPKTFKTAGELMELGADFGVLILNLQRRNSVGFLKLLGELSTRIEVDEKHRFAWSAIPYNVYKRHKVDISPTSDFADKILRTVLGADFVIAMVEKEKKLLHMSLRARIFDFDVSLLAKELGGGGHRDASGASLKGLPFDEAVKKVLETAKKYSRV